MENKLQDDHDEQIAWYMGYRYSRKYLRPRLWKALAIYCLRTLAILFFVFSFPLWSGYIPSWLPAIIRYSILIIYVGGVLWLFVRGLNSKNNRASKWDIFYRALEVKKWRDEKLKSINK